MVPDKIVVEITIGKSGAVRCDQQVGIGEIGGVDGRKFDLDRPLGQAAWNVFRSGLVLDGAAG